MAISATPGSLSFNALWKETQARDLKSLNNCQYNPREFTSLANHWENSRKLFDKVNLDGISDDERQKLLDRVDGFQQLSQKYTQGNYQPVPAADDPFKTKCQALKGLPRELK